MNEEKERRTVFPVGEKMTHLRNILLDRVIYIC